MVPGRVTPATTEHVVILTADTGGGHRATAEAIEEALRIRCRDAVRITVVDVFKGFAPYPFDHFPAWYPAMVGRERLWKTGFRLLDTALATRVLREATYPYVRPAFRRLVHEHPADTYVSVHPLLTMPAVKALGKNRPPFITVVSDLVSAHAFWFYPGVDTIIVPTEAAYARARRCGVPADRLKVIGLPVSQRFSRQVRDKAQLRRRLGWPADLRTVLVVGGGEGMGPLFDIVRHLAGAANPDARCHVAVVAGRNEELQTRLRAAAWSMPAHVYGFVANMPDLMSAADLIVTKAGPSSVMEALNVGIPMVLSGALPGQEEGNVELVVKHGAGFWAPTPEGVAGVVRELFSSPVRLEQVAANARSLARPEAALEVAAEIARHLGATGRASQSRWQAS